MLPREVFLFDCFRYCLCVADCCRESALRLTDLVHLTTADNFLAALLVHLATADDFLRSLLVHLATADDFLASLLVHLATTDDFLAALLVHLAMAAISMPVKACNLDLH